MKDAAVPTKIQEGFRITSCSPNPCKKINGACPHPSLRLSDDNLQSDDVRLVSITCHSIPPILARIPPPPVRIHIPSFSCGCCKEIEKGCRRRKDEIVKDLRNLATENCTRTLNLGFNSVTISLRNGDTCI